MIGENVKAWRKKRGLTQEQLAQNASISQSMVVAIEKDKVNPSIPVMEAIAKVLKLPVSVLLEEDQSSIGEIVGLNELLQDVDQETKAFLSNTSNKDYIVLAKDIKKADLTPEQVRELIQVIKKLKD